MTRDEINKQVVRKKMLRQSNLFMIMSLFIMSGRG